MILYDERWSGAHGIGRFAAEIAERIPHRNLNAGGRPMAAFDSARLALALRADPEPVFLSPGYSPPLWCRNPFIFTLHDLNHIDRPENSSLSKRFFYATVLRSACRRAAAVLTVSDHSRRRIVEWAGVPESHVVNVGNGVGPSFRSDAEPHAPGFPYVLCVGNRKGHKNEFRVVEAFARAGLPPDIRLLLTGEPAPELTRHATVFGLGERVAFLGRVEERRLPGLYRGALCLAFPSLYEGFGLPVIEAFACGTPVLTSLTTSLPEVAGDAALLVDPQSVEAIADALRRLVTDEHLRDELRARGLRRAARFSWPQVAQRVQEVVTQVEASRKRRSGSVDRSAGHAP